MRLRKLHVTNMFPYGDAKVDLQGYDLALIVGDNDEEGKDSNGSGKSFLLDAIALAMFGKVIRKIPVDHWVRFGQTQGRIILSFDLGGARYRIRRYRGANNALEFHRRSKGETADLTAKTATLTQKAIEQVIGMDFDTFRAIAYFGQKDVSVFAEGTSKDRLQIVGTILRLGLLDDAAKIARDRMREAEQEYGSIGAVLERDRKELELLDPDRAEREVAECKEQIVKHEGLLEEAERELERVSQIRAALVRLEDAEAQVETIKSDWRRDRDKYNQRIQAAKDQSAKLDEYRQQVQELEQAVAPLPGLREEKDAVEAKVGQARQRYSTYEGQRNTIQKEREAILQALDLEGGVCPTCSQMIGTDAVASLKEKAQMKDDAAGDLLRKMKKIRSRIEEAAGDVLKLKERIDQLEIQRGNLERARLALNEAEGADRHVKQLESDLAARRSDAKEAVAKLEAKIATIQGDLPEGMGPDAVDQVTAKFATQKSDSTHRLRNLREQKARCESEIRSAERLRAEIEDHEREGERLKAIHATAGYWVDGFPRIKLLIVDSFIPEFERAVNKYLSMLAPTVQMRFDTLVPKKGSNAGYMERFEIFIRDIHTGRESPWDSWSGGEKKRVALALYMGLNLVASKAMESRIGFLMLDEVLADLDATGRELAMDLFQQEKRGNRQILLISHLPGIHSRFDDVITVVKRNGVATIRT